MIDLDTQQPSRIWRQLCHVYTGCFFLKASLLLLLSFLTLPCIKYVNAGGKKLKLAIWDTAYDVTRRETFTNLCNIWAKEIELYSTNPDCIKMLVGNKVDKVLEHKTKQNDEKVTLFKNRPGLQLHRSGEGTIAICQEVMNVI